jgi:hypothetical protein
VWTKVIITCKSIAEGRLVWFAACERDREPFPKGLSSNSLGPEHRLRLCVTQASDLELEHKVSLPTKTRSRS